MKSNTHCRLVLREPDGGVRETGPKNKTKPTTTTFFEASLSKTVLKMPRHANFQRRVRKIETVRPLQCTLAYGIIVFGRLLIPEINVAIFASYTLFQSPVPLYSDGCCKPWPAVVFNRRLRSVKHVWQLSTVSDLRLLPFDSLGR